MSELGDSRNFRSPLPFSKLVRNRDLLAVWTAFTSAENSCQNSVELLRASPVIWSWMGMFLDIADLKLHNARFYFPVLLGGLLPYALLCCLYVHDGSGRFVWRSWRKLLLYDATRFVGYSLLAYFYRKASLPKLGAKVWLNGGGLAAVWSILNCGGPE